MKTLLKMFRAIRFTNTAPLPEDSSLRLAVVDFQGLGKYIVKRRAELGVKDLDFTKATKANRG